MESCNEHHSDECISPNTQAHDQPKLKINFQLLCTEEDWIARYEFWESSSTALWFRRHGYILYQRIFKGGERTDTWKPTISCDTRVEMNYPYAHYDGSIVDQIGRVSLRASEQQGKIGFAQDLFNHHVAIKIVHPNSDEMKIFRFLRAQDMETLKENCILPVLDIIPAESFNFVVMPRWGTHTLFPWPENARGIIHFMHSMLKALSFLHKNNIAHMDISARNMLVNQFDDAYSPSSPGTMRGELRSTGRLLFAMFDFDLSFKLPPKADRHRYKLPTEICWDEYGLRTETAQGEPFVNPFVDDVGTLGTFFAQRFQHLTGTIPLLAPLLDKMMARPLSARFRAEDALAFFENNFLTMSDAELDLPAEPFLYEKHGRVSVSDYERWAVVPPDFAEKWSAFREPPVNWYTALLRRIVLTKVGAHIVYWVRWIFERPWGESDDMWFE